MLRAGLLMTGGKLLATGGYCGISQSPLHVASGFVISGGTIVARGDSCDMYNSLGIVINGGSVDARKFSIFPPKGADGKPVYLVTVTVGEQAVTNRQVECAVNDGEAFASCTDAQGKLYLWMPEGQGGADVNVDGTVYRASGPVAATFDNTMLAKAGSIVTGVVITPSYTTALTGGTVQYSARVEGLHTRRNP
jgi:hypothetical protein